MTTIAALLLVRPLMNPEPRYPFDRREIDFHSGSRLFEENNDGTR